jgi:Bacterial regulatory proteins, luxR family
MIKPDDRSGQVSPDLTVREREVLELMARGHNNIAIARRLVLSDPNPRVAGPGDLRLVLLIFRVLFWVSGHAAGPGGRAGFAGSGGCRGGEAWWSGRRR